ncbi:TauD/TfdA dioxygenase family protein [Yinghuangia soli]|uniref:TauD/TfdA family dioxygenase n=1 Tax=Yinghuangia soli TaxID=2908204 RepID=A0AA41Q5B3_9ACTN|nr:TauD/TfdA family dioxygenase [Yinghuangia soli]MCF2531844.1 TauD/TfdA family dioxygenase [Yinghuangia soli]
MPPAEIAPSPDRTAAPAAPQVTVTPVAGRIGAVLGGVRLSGDLDAGTVQEIRDALHAHKVVFFRGQDHLDDREQVAFTRLLGEPSVHPLVDHDDGFVLPITSGYGGQADAWHTDLTFVPDFPAVSILRAVRLPAFGGDTMWANTAAAYAGMPEPLRDFADRLDAVHSNVYDYSALAPERDPEAHAWYRELLAAAPFEAVHPVVGVHPETRERTLLLGGFAQRLDGFSAADSATLVRLLQGHVIRAENTVRWSWRPGDVAMWDNRATQHRVVADFGDAVRVLHRTTVGGPESEGVDGRRGRVAGVPGRA